MPTHDETTAFQRDRDRLTDEQVERFKARVADFIADLKEMPSSELLASHQTAPEAPHSIQFPQWVCWHT